MSSLQQRKEKICLDDDSDSMGLEEQILPHVFKADHASSASIAKTLRPTYSITSRHKPAGPVFIAPLCWCRIYGKIRGGFREHMFPLLPCMLAKQIIRMEVNIHDSDHTLNLVLPAIKVLRDMADIHCSKQLLFI